MSSCRVRHLPPGAVIDVRALGLLPRGARNVFAWSPAFTSSLLLAIKALGHWLHTFHDYTPLSLNMPPRPSIPAKRPAADAQEAAWVADEDRFVLQQAKRKSAIRAKSGRAAPIDWLAVTLAVIDPERNPLDDEIEDGGLDLVDPESVFEGLGEEELGELEKGIQTYVTLESSRSNLEYWNVSTLFMQIYTRD